MDDCRLNVRRHQHWSIWQLFHKHYVFVLPAPPGIFSEKRELDYSFLGVWTHCRWTWNDEMTWTFHIVSILFHIISPFVAQPVSIFWNIALQHNQKGASWDTEGIRFMLSIFLKWRAVTGSKQARLAKWCTDHQLHHMHQKQLNAETWKMTPSEGTLNKFKGARPQNIGKGRCVRAFALANCARDATHQQQGFGSHEAFPALAAKTLGAFLKHMLAFWPIPERRAFTSFCFRMFWCFGLSLKEVVLWPVDFSSIELPKPLQKKASHSMESGVPAIPKNATVEVIVEVHGSLWLPFMDRHVESSQMLLNSVWLILFESCEFGPLDSLDMLG